MSLLPCCMRLKTASQFGSAPAALLNAVNFRAHRIGSQCDSDLRMRAFHNGEGPLLKSIRLDPMGLAELPRQDLCRH